VWLCERCGSELIPQDKSCWNCGLGLSGEALAQVETKIAAEEARRVPSYAGFWERAGATIADTIIVGGPLFMIYVITDYLFPNFIELHQPGALWGVGGGVALVSWLYFAGMESSKRQATIGKQILELRVTDLKGRRISFGRASVRFFVGWIFDRIPSGYGLIDVIPVAFTKKKQAMHDFVAETLVMSDYEAMPEPIDARAHERVRFGGDSLNESQPSG
jgi:uncharacterized RDD family membrane protein YckC